nr:hypothetical protein [Tanacetum cinerariifolium]
METKDTLSSCSNSEAQQMQQIQDKAKKSCKRLSQNDLQGRRTESGFKRAFVTPSGQDIETFTSTMFLNMEQLEKQLDKEDFQEIGSMAAFNVIETQFQMFITSRVYLNDEYVAMTRNYFIQYTQLAILKFYDTLIQHLESVKKSIVERAQLKREYDSWVNERQMQTTEEKVDMSKALDASSVDTASSRTESKEQDTSIRAGNDAHDDGADIRPIYDEDPMAKENETLKKHYKELFDSIKITRAKTIEHTASLIGTNDKFKAQLQEKGFAIAALKNELRKSTGNSVNTKFVKLSILGNPMLQSHRNQSVVRQPTAFKSERPRILEPRFASQVDVHNDLSKPVTIHYLPKEREATSAKPHHMTASSNSRVSSKNMPRFSSNDMVYNHYLEEAKKKTQEHSRNSEPSLMPSARSQSTTNGSKPKPRSNTQTSRNWPASKSSFATTKTAPIEEHSRNSMNFSDSKHFVCSTCQKNSRMKSAYVLRWKLTGKVFKTVSLRWVPTGKIFTSSTTKIDSEPSNGLIADITNQYECTQTLNVSVDKYLINQGFKDVSTDEQGMNFDHNSSELELHNHNNEQSRLKLVPNVVPPAEQTDTSRQEMEFLFHHHITML